MHNILSEYHQPQTARARKYDLKVRPAGEGAATYKDVDFRNNMQKVYVSEEEKEKIMDKLIRDTEFLVQMRIMDYSLLLGIHDVERAEREEEEEDEEEEDDDDNEQMDSSYDEEAEEENGLLTFAPSSTSPEGIAGYMNSFKPMGPGDSTRAPQREVYFMGLIDVLTQYDTKKKAAHAAKAVKHGLKLVPPLLCEILSVVATVRLGVMATGKLDVAAAAKPTVVAMAAAEEEEEDEEEMIGGGGGGSVGSFGQPCWSRMSTHSWLPAQRARANAVCPSCRAEPGSRSANSDLEERARLSGAFMSSLVQWANSSSSLGRLCSITASRRRPESVMSGPSPGVGGGSGATNSFCSYLALIQDSRSSLKQQRQHRAGLRRPSVRASQILLTMWLPMARRTRVISRGRSSRSSERTRVRWVPRFLWIPEHSMQMRAPRFRLAQLQTCQDLTLDGLDPGIPLLHALGFKVPRLAEPTSLVDEELETPSTAESVATAAEESEPNSVNPMHDDFLLKPQFTLRFFTHRHSERGSTAWTDIAALLCPGTSLTRPLRPTGGPQAGMARGGRFPGTFTVTRSRSISFPGVLSM
ncbi:hypothetical protein INR49_009337 [Caranx melampygus]|nr:hypothetical protein INR49_009337 [Caranx melampygus]